MSMDEKNHIHNSEFLRSKLYYFDRQSLDEYIKNRAYYIWKEEGMPKDRDKEIWLRAEKEGMEMLAAQTGSLSPQTEIADKRPLGTKNQMYSRITSIEKSIHHLFSPVSKIEQQLVSLFEITSQKSSQTQENELQKKVSQLEKEKVFK